MKKMLFLFAIVMLGIAGCQKEVISPNDPENPTNETIVSFTLSSTMAVTLPSYYVVDQKDAVGVMIYNSNGIPIYTFYVKSGSTRTFKGDSAKMFLGKDMSVTPALQTYDGRNGLKPYAGYLYTPKADWVPVAKANNYSFTITYVSGVN